LETYQRRFRLLDWDIRFTPDNANLDKDCTAQLDIEDIRRRATLRLSEQVVGDQIERHVVHEMTHLVLRDFQVLSMQTAAKAGAGGLAVIDVLADQLERICETVAEAMTHVPWEPFSKKIKACHAPFARDVNHSISEKESK